MSTGSSFEVKIPSDTAEGLRIQEQIIGLLEQHEYSARDVFAMRLTLEEAITNAIRHGNKFAEDKSVTISCSIDADRIRVVIQDEGEGFDPNMVPDPTDELFLELPCGRGLMLLQAYLDFCEYSDDGRRITMERGRNSERPIIDDDDD